MIENIKIGSIVYDKEFCEIFYINDSDDLDCVLEDFEIRFSGLLITQNNIFEIFSDFNIIQSFCTGLKIKYNFFDNDSQKRPMFTIYCRMDDGNGPYFMESSFDEETFIVTYSDGNDSYHDIYYVSNRNKVHIKYIHELQNLIDFLKKNTFRLVSSIGKN